MNAAEPKPSRLFYQSGLRRPMVDRAEGISEAVEICLKLARQWAVATGQDTRRKVSSRFPAPHGSTLGAPAVAGYVPDPPARHPQ